jgi:pimeloyl-ACP methyl ester carboxylesterase
MFAYTAGHAFDKAKPTMVFLHGAGLDHSAFLLQSRYFGYHGWNVLAFDLPGHGRSAGAPISSVRGMAEEVCKAVPAEKFSIVGHSMGALIALECAASVPSRVERIALIGVAYPMKVGAAFLEAAKRDDYDAFDMHTIWGHAPQVPLGRDATPGMWTYGDTQARLERLAPGVLYNDLKACNDYVFEGDVTCPALFILGKRDMMTPPRNASDLMKRIPNSKSMLVDFSGHTLMTEAPDQTLDALIDFFRT